VDPHWFQCWSRSSILVNADPEPDPGIWWPKIVKFYRTSKLQASSPEKITSSTSKQCVYFFLLILWIIFVHLDADPARTNINIDLCGSWSRTLVLSKIFFFYLHWKYYFSKASMKDVKATGEAISPQKRTSRTSKQHVSSLFFLYLWVIFCSPRYGSSQDEY
jgi:hypothetical protein